MPPSPPPSPLPPPTKQPVASVLKISIIQDGVEDTVFEVEGNEATLGRARDCDIVIPNVHVSGRHVRVLSGLVVMDLKSTNSTFIDGAKIKGAAVAPRGEFQMGGEIVVRVEDTSRASLSDEFGPLPEMTIPMGQPSAHEELDEERRRNAKLQSEMDELRRQMADATAGIGDDGESPLETENRDLSRRIESLKGEIEERDSAAAESLQARLSQDALADVQRTNETLQARIHELEAQQARPDVELARQALQERLGELEAGRANLIADLEGLRIAHAELAERAERDAERPASEVFFALQSEISRLKSELEDAHGDAAAPPAESGELYFELKQANEQLERDLTKARAAAEETTTVSTVDPEVVAQLKGELHAERMTKIDMLAELDDLRHKAGTAPADYSMSDGTSSVAAMSLIRKAARDDIDALAPDPTRPPVDFLAMELFRFMRVGERFITRMTGGFHQILEPSTMMPGTEWTLRELTIAVIDSEDPAARSDFLEYMDHMQRGLLVSEQAYLRAAERFAFELREELSERGLTAGDPIPRLKRLSGQAEGELWERATRTLAELSDETVRDRVQRFARETALELIEQTR